MENKKNRIWEIDFLRGIAIITMVYYHIIFDLEVLYSLDNISTDKGFAYIAGYVGGLFILLSGISSTLSRNNLKRGIKLFIISMLLTLVSFIMTMFDDIFHMSTFIKFGILHFLSISMIITPIFLKIKKSFIYLIIAALILITNYFIIPYINFTGGYLFPLGITNHRFSSLDYFPIFPWFGIYLIGLFIGKVIYKNKSSLFKVERFKFLSFLGKKSLFIYLVHQPIVLIILSIIFIFI